MGNFDKATRSENLGMVRDREASLDLLRDVEMYITPSLSHSQLLKLEGLIAQGGGHLFLVLTLGLV